MIESYGLCDVGLVRKQNQDRILIDDSVGLFVVADGMGGHVHGEIAAQEALTAIQFYIDSSRERFDVSWPFGYSFDLSIDANRITTGIHLANRRVRQQAQRAPDTTGMGTTVAAVLVNESHAVVANVGDSRVYLYRQGDFVGKPVGDEVGEKSEDKKGNHPLRAAEKLSGKHHQGTIDPIRTPGRGWSTSGSGRSGPVRYASARGGPEAGDRAR